MRLRIPGVEATAQVSPDLVVLVLHDSKRLHRGALCIWSSEPDDTVVSRELCAC